MIYVILLLASIGSTFLIGKYLKLSKTFTYTFSIFLAIFTVNGYAILLDGFIDPLIIIASLSVVPLVVIIVMLWDFFIDSNAEKRPLKEFLYSGSIAAFLVAGPLLGYLEYTTSNSYTSVQDVPDWSDKEKKVAFMAIDALKEHPLRTSYFGLARKSIVFLNDSNAYRVIFAFKGHELAEVIVDADAVNIMDIKVHPDPIKK